jgi:NitT/TauT family transport system ATP-binding protein
MAPEPGRIVCRFELDRPAARRDDAWVYRHTAELLQTPDVRTSFGLPPVVEPERATRAQGQEAVRQQGVRQEGAAQDGAGQEGAAGAGRAQPLSGLRLVSPATGLIAVQGGKRCGA